jgi:hypothetical protein
VDASDLANTKFPPAMSDATARRGGFMRIANNPAAALAVIFQPVRGGKRYAGGETESERRAFRKRVAKRRARKGYA